MDSSLFQNLGRELAPEQVTQRLREAIAVGALHPGQRLNQAELAERLGVSRMPIREALRRLEAEGLVVMQPYKGAVVAGLSAEELNEIYEMRIALEVLALRRSVPNMDDEALGEMRRLLEEMDREEDTGAWVVHNRRFHDLLYQRAERALLLDIIDNLRVKSDRFLRLFATRRDRTDHAQEEHWAIYEACRQRDVDAAARLLQGHLQSTVTSLSKSLRADAEAGNGVPKTPEPRRGPVAKPASSRSTKE